MNPELIRYARRHRYEIAEGFCDEGEEASEWQAAMESVYENLPLDQQELFDNEAEELSARAGIPLDEAQSALVNWIVKQFQARKNN